jgi:hypothetical protein
MQIVLSVSCCIQLSNKLFKLTEIHWLANQTRAAVLPFGGYSSLHQQRPDEKPLTRNYGKSGSRMALARKALHAIKQAIKLYIQPLIVFLFSYQSMHFKMMCAESWRFSYPGNYSIACKDCSALVCTSATVQQLLATAHVFV